MPQILNLDDFTGWDSGGVAQQGVLDPATLPLFSYDLAQMK